MDEHKFQRELDSIENADQAVEFVSRLINVNRWPQARGAGRRLVGHYPEDTAHLWFQAALAELLVDPWADVSQYRQQAKLCNDYTTLLEGDFDRDAAGAAIKRGDLRAAQNYLKRAEECHRDDINRLACITSFEGRIKYRMGDYPGAVFRHQTAHIQWLNLDDGADLQWIRNNLVVWLKAIAQTEGWKARWPIFRHVLLRNHNKQHIARATTVFILGRYGNKLDDLLQQRRFHGC